LLKRFLSIFLVITIVFVAVPVNICFAKDVEGPVIDIKILKIDGKPDGITVALDFVQNPGIGAMAFTIKYDNTVFETKAIRKRYFYSCALAGYLIVDHPETGYVSIVWADGGNTDDYTGTGTIIQLDFNIKNRKKGEYVFSAANSNPSSYGNSLSGCFADFKKNTLLPIINPATIYIGEKGNCSSYAEHDFTDWQTVNPSCEIDGSTQRYCKNCEYVERKILPATGHAYETEYTVDREASDGVLGIKSRHCKICGDRTDKKYFSVENNKEIDMGKVSSKEENNEIKKILEIDSEKEDEGFVSIPDATEIIEKYEKEFSGDGSSKIKTIGDFITFVHNYLFGTSESNGIFNVIKKILKKAFS